MHTECGWGGGGEGGGGTMKRECGGFAGKGSGWSPGVLCGGKRGERGWGIKKKSSGRVWRQGGESSGRRE